MLCSMKLYIIVVTLIDVYSKHFLQTDIFLKLALKSFPIIINILECIYFSYVF